MPRAGDSGVLAHAWMFSHTAADGYRTCLIANRQAQHSRLPMPLNQPQHNRRIAAEKTRRSLERRACFNRRRCELRSSTRRRDRERSASTSIPCLRQVCSASSSSETCFGSTQLWTTPASAVTAGGYGNSASPAPFGFGRGRRPSSSTGSAINRTYSACAMPTSAPNSDRPNSVVTHGIDSHPR